MDQNLNSGQVHEEKVVHKESSNKLISFRDKLPSDKKRLILLGLIVLAIPLTITLALVQQELRSRAAEVPATPATPPEEIPTITPAPTGASSSTITPTITSLSTPSPLPTDMPTLTPSNILTPTPTLTKVTLNPNADAFVRSTAPTTNFGTAANLKNDLSPDEISYIRFNLSTLAGKNIKSAKLILTVSDPTNSILSLRNADDSDWSEAGITYSKRPPFVNTVTSFNAKTKDVKVSLDVTARVSNKKGTRATFGIKSTADDSGAFYSRNALDATKRPQLVVEYQ